MKYTNFNLLAALAFSFLLLLVAADFARVKPLATQSIKRS